MIYSRIGQIPKHLYCHVDTQFTHKEPSGTVPCIWFGLVSDPGRAWGCNVLLENGAVYRNLPINALSFTSHLKPWSLEQAQLYNCYSDEFTVIEYNLLSGLKCAVHIKKKIYYGHYLFTVAPLRDGFSAEPEQNKEFMFIQLENGRMTVQPTNCVRVEDVSFTLPFGDDAQLPRGLKSQRDVYRVEEGGKVGKGRKRKIE